MTSSGEGGQDRRPPGTGPGAGPGTGPVEGEHEGPPTAALPVTPSPGAAADGTAGSLDAEPTGTPRVLGGRYELGRVLGRGGMAVVHEAHDRLLGRQVAVKLLRSDLAEDGEVLARFRREARSVAALNHPAVVGVHDVGEEPGRDGGTSTPFLVMELVRGATVRDLLDQHRPPEQHRPLEQHRPHDRHRPPAGASAGERPSAGDGRGDDDGWADDRDEQGARPGQPGVDLETAVAVTAGVLGALAYSHRAGIVHRDIKPANVMLTPEGQVKVMDFGIARALADAGATATHTSVVLGTAQYLSPEQARGRPVDARTDLYSTGCLLYELLTGRPPFQGDSAVSLAYQHVGEAPDPPSAHRTGLPPALDGVVLRALAKEPADRYPDAETFRRDLEDAARGLDVAGPAAVAAASTTVVPPVAPPPPSPGPVPLGPVPLGDGEEPTEGGGRGRRAVVVLAALVALALVALAAVLVPRLTGEDPAPTSTVPDVVGSTAEAARAAVERAGLAYAEESAPSEEVSEGRVAEQDPAAGGTAPRGSTVTVVVSTGPTAVAVPDLAGRTEGQAASDLAAVGLRLGDVERRPDPSAPEGVVLTSDPSSGASAAPGSAVDLVVSDGTVEIDDYRGLPQTEAQRALSALQLQSDVQFTESDAAEGTVVRQDPGAGPVPQGSTVVLVVATPPPPTPTTPPAPTPTEAPTTPEPTEPEPTTPEPTTPEPTTPEPTTPEPTTPEPTTTQTPPGG
ncbi:PASTA domain-containing protein [Pseudokineococcus sp. 5B2Z-1]|uniref:protein kinase domain-containing protein n=1 Tax=Pseudokineococcus sp. 5B2Z-1 TaxID=3132744 RepID=UPI0030A6A71D